MQKLRNFIQEHRGFSIAIGGILAVALIGCCLISAFVGGDEEAIPESTDTLIFTDTPFPIASITDSSIPTDILTPELTNTPESTDTPESNDTFAPFPSGGLGMNKRQWEQEHTGTGIELGMTVYDNGAYLVTFVDEKIQYLEPIFDELSIEKARAFAATLLPEDMQFVETYSPEGLSFLTVDLYMSESLKDQFASDWFIGGDPGNFIIVYGDNDDDGQIERIVIATGNNP